MKTKPITFSDLRGLGTQQLNENIIERKVSVLSDMSLHGRSYYYVECPFCLDRFRAYKWSLRGGGKRCPKCKGMMTSFLNMYQWKEIVE